MFVRTQTSDHSVNDNSCTGLYLIPDRGSLVGYIYQRKHIYI